MTVKLGGVDSAPPARAGSGGECLADESRERLDVVCILVATAVDEEAWSPGDAARVCAVDVIGDARRVPPGAEVVPKALEVETELVGVAFEIGQLECLLVADKEIVHWPERPLCCGGLGRLGRQLRLRVDVAQREVAPDVAQFGREVGEQLTDRRLRPAAVGALEVSV